MARVRRRREPESTGESQHKEETAESEPKAEDAVAEDKSGSTETNSGTVGVTEEKAEGKKRMSAKEKAKGKRPMEAEKGKKDTKDINEMVMQGKGKAEGIVIREAKKPETEARGRPKRGTRGWRRGRASAVKSTYSLRSGLKGEGVEEVPSSIVGRKHKAKEEEADDAVGEEEDAKGACKRIKKERYSDDDTDGGGGGKDLPGSSAGAAIVGAV